MIILSCKGGILALDYVKKYPEKVNSMSNHNIKNGLDKINCKSLILCGSKDKANMKSANLMGRIFNYFEFTFSYTLTNLFRSVDRIDRGSSCRCKLYFWRGI